jgi:hypothetical protein
VTKKRILNHLYEAMGAFESNITDMFVCKLRKKLAQAAGDSHYIETVWGTARCCVSQRTGRPRHRWISQRPTTGLTREQEPAVSSLTRDIGASLHRLTGNRRTAVLLIGIEGKSSEATAQGLDSTGLSPFRPEVGRPTVRHGETDCI